jgi:hypothetical protein
VLLLLCILEAQQGCHTLKLSAITLHIATTSVLMNYSLILPCHLTFIILRHIWSLKYIGKCHVQVSVCLLGRNLNVHTLRPPPPKKKLRQSGVTIGIEICLLKVKLSDFYRIGLCFWLYCAILCIFLSIIMKVLQIVPIIILYSTVNWHIFNKIHAMMNT